MPKLVRVVFSSAALLSMIGYLSIEVWAHVKTNRNRTVENTVAIEKIKTKQSAEEKLLNEMRTDIKTILKEMPRD